MDFSGLQKAVTDAWEFLWPSIINLVLLAAIAFYFARDVLAALARKLTLPSWTFIERIIGHKAFETFGLGKLLPLIGLFSIIFILYITQVAVHGIGNLLPGHVVYRNDLLQAHSLSDEQLACLWARFPDASSLDDLGNLIEQKLVAATEKGKASAVSNIDYWNERVGRAAQAVDTVKFLIIWTIICEVAYIIQKRRVWTTLRRLFVCIFVLLIVGGYFFTKHIYAIEQVGYAKASAARLVIAIDGSSCESIPEEKLAACEPRIRAVREEQQREGWWQIDAFESYYNKSIVRMLLNKGT